MESDFITKYNVEEILKYINSINVDVARIFYLYFMADMKFKEISEELEMNESTVKSSLYRMLRKIKKSNLGGEENHE